MSAKELSDTHKRKGRRVQALWILAVFLIVLAADQATKTVVAHAIPENSVSFAGRETQFFYLTHERNTGLAGGAFGNTEWFALVARLVATLILVYLYRYLDTSSRLQSIAFGMVAGGAIGNLIDRVFRDGGVVDFLQFNFYFVPIDFAWKLFPAFNVADTAICTGVFLLLVSWTLFGREAAQRGEPAQEEA